MLDVIAQFSLLMSALNWFLFAYFAYVALVKDARELRRLRDSLLEPTTPPTGAGVTVQQSGMDPAKLASATGALAGAFKKAGPAPTAAALSVLFMLCAILSAGVDKF